LLMSKLLEDLVEKKYLHSEKIIKAFADIDRSKFVPGDLVDQAEANVALPIGYGQTISQPLTVAFMMELLDPEPGNNILDVGSGSGWTTALLAHVAGEKGKVIAIEMIRELYEFGKKNVGKFNFIRNGIVEFYCISAENGFEKNSPYDRILVSAGVKKDVPEALKKQLLIGGKMVIPVDNEIWCLEKKSEKDFNIEKFPGFAFVPFVKKNAKYQS
jgi:protein-L-isoaspartate(D-aspartate) O-methyltransferase